MVCSPGRLNGRLLLVVTLNIALALPLLFALTMCGDASCACGPFAGSFKVKGTPAAIDRAAAMRAAKRRSPGSSAPTAPSVARESGRFARKRVQASGEAPPELPVRSLAAIPSHTTVGTVRF
jgi:hypothetical protein